MRILVTGGAGFIGSHLVNRLSANHDITVIDNLERGHLKNIKSDIIFKQLDLRNFESIKDCFNGIDLVIHLASKVGGINTYTSRPYEVLSSNILIDLNVLRAALSAGISKYFYASSAHVYPRRLQNKIDAPLIIEEDCYPADCELSYGWAKLIGEEQLRYAHQENKKFKYAIARLVGVYGTNQDINLDTGSVIPVFCNRAVQYPAVPFSIYGNGEETRSYCFINDVLDCIQLMIDRLDKEIIPPINVGSQDLISINNLARKIINISGKDININYIGTKNALIQGQFCSMQKAKIVLGWEASTTIDDGLAIVYNSIKEIHNVK